MVDARAVLEAAWHPPGFCVPNPTAYPWQWLWDSCFHAVVWAELGDAERAQLELRNALAHQASDGFVPHLTYHGDREAHAAFWGRRDTSCITQPPMYAHALAALRRRGIGLDRDLVVRAERGVEHLLSIRPRHDSGLVAVLHPWETGCDDSARWDAWGCADNEVWRRRKGEFVASLEFDADSDAPRTNRAFSVGSAGFNALVAHAAFELAEVTGDARWQDEGESLAATLDERWNAGHRTWTDAGPDGPITTRTLDALLPLLVTTNGEAVQAVAADLLDDRAYGGLCGPAGVHREEPAYEPARYWRGGAWPQLTYLLSVAAHRQALPALATELAKRLRRGAEASQFAEYWDPDTGAPGGARPQSWSTLGVGTSPVS